MNNSLIIILKKAGEAAIRTTGNPSLILAIGIAIGVVTVARALSKSRGGGYNPADN